VAEGVEATVPATGPVASTLESLACGLRAGLGYLGAADIGQLARTARYVRQSPAGLVESGVHDVRVDEPVAAGRPS
jgi:IMP dehydrogenase